MDRPLINTVSEAFEFLRHINIDVIGHWDGWILTVIRPGSDFELLLHTNVELIDLARWERNQCIKLADSLGLNRLELLPIFHSYSSMAPQPARDQSQDAGWPTTGETRKEVTS